MTAVVPGYVASAAIAWAASTAATATGASIGTASADRVVVVGLTVEADVNISSVTIGGISATAGPQARDTGGTPDNVAGFWYALVPTGTTANIVAVASASITQTGRISVWAMTGAHPVHVDSNTNTGSGATITLTGVTVPAGGAGFWVFNNATTGTAVGWTNATERDDTSVTNYRHSAADTTTAGTLTITADGANAAQAIAGMSFTYAVTAQGWDVTPYVEMAPRKPRTAALALMASGLIWAPQAVPPDPVPSADWPVVQVTNSQVRTKTLFYQAWAKPIAPPAAAPSNLTTSIEWLRPLDRAVPPRRPSKTNVILPAQPPTAAPAVDTVNAAASTTAHRSGSRSLFYQAYAAPPPAAPAAVVVADISWHAPFSAPPPRRILIGRLAQPFVPALAPVITPDEWLQPFRRNVAGPFPVHTQPVLSYTPAAPPTVDEWLTPFSRAVARPEVSNALHSPFVPEEATLENTVPFGWAHPFRRAAQAPPPVHTQPLIGYAPVAEDNTVTPEKWMQPFYKAAPIVRPAQSQAVLGTPPETSVTIDKWQLVWNLAPRGTTPVHTQPFYGFPYEGVDNTRVEWDWTLQWQGPPRYTPPKILAQPFVPREATLENTVDQGWRVPLSTPVPARPVWRTQPFYGFPYEGVDNTRTEWDWSIQWKGPPRYWPPGRPYQPFVPREATRENTITGIAWLQGFRAPPRYWALKVLHQPFVPKAAIVDQVTPDKWLQGFRGVPPRRVVRTQPVLGYPYEAVVTLTTSIEWLRQWQGAVPRKRPIHTQPFFGYPYEAGVVANVTFSIDALPPTGRPLHYQSIAEGYPPPPPPPPNTETIDKWQQPFPLAVPRPPVWVTQPSYDAIEPPVVAAAVGGGFTVTSQYRRTRSLYYQAWAAPVQPPGAIVYQQQITINITVAFERMLRYACKAEEDDGSVVQAEQGDAWVVQTEQEVNFVDQAEQGDPWGTQTEDAEEWDEEDPTPESGCP